MTATPIIFGFAAGFVLIAFVSMTAFVKISVVFMILRQALGMQQIPSNVIVMALAIFLSVYVTWPVLNQSVSNIQALDLSVVTPGLIQDLWSAAIVPFQGFMAARIDAEQSRFLAEISADLWASAGTSAETGDFIIQVPAFLISELTAAFEIGFLIYLPFIAIDLAVTGILMALGMQMVQPNIIAVPFKLLTFVFVDGWGKLAEGLVVTYLP